MKEKLYLITLVFLGCILIYACSSSHHMNGKMQTGKYNFTLMDSANNSLADGVLNIETAAKRNMSGTYSVTKMYVDKVNGLKSSGEFEATSDVTMKIFTINMDPKIADANLFVNANYTGDSLNGTWYYSTMMGAQTGGNFKAALVQ